MCIYSITSLDQFEDTHYSKFLDLIQNNKISDKKIIDLTSMIFLNNLSFFEKSYTIFVVLLVQYLKDDQLLDLVLHFQQLPPL